MIYLNALIAYILIKCPEMERDPEFKRLVKKIAEWLVERER